MPCAAVAEPEIVPRFLGGRWLILREVVFEALNGWPSVHNGVCRLQLEASPRQALDDAVDELALAIAEAQLRVLERGEDDRLTRG